IIGAGESGSSLIFRVLSWRPIVFVGLISYSLYLWHWPIIVLNDLGFTVNLSGLALHRWEMILSSPTGKKALEILLSFILATLSWRFVERPFRARPRRIERRPLFALSAAVMIVLILCSGSVIYARGFQGRFPARAVQVASFLSSSGAPTRRVTAKTDSTVNASTKETPTSESATVNAPPAGTPTLGQLGNCAIAVTNQAK